ncbi:hypothetical protein [Chroococcidiopsis sp. SAG 2025]|nr:hypothetical protein [Chroococcidiopsis sp. SAG 2025]
MRSEGKVTQLEIVPTKQITYGSGDRTSQRAAESSGKWDDNNSLETEE